MLVAAAPLGEKLEPGSRSIVELGRQLFAPVNAVPRVPFPACFCWGGDTTWCQPAKLPPPLPAYRHLLRACAGSALKLGQGDSRIKDSSFS